MAVTTEQLQQLLAYVDVAVPLMVLTNIPLKRKTRCVNWALQQIVGRSPRGGRLSPLPRELQVWLDRSQSNYYAPSVKSDIFHTSKHS